ncbi:MAG: rRNA pseudouridine synthase [Saprospiraceae bacterium]|nr:rRNA pseudouridine synthase [Saprospiraceae bacterium]MBK8485289.1 rRNA pseudouridine synthase [Saprospiraceae bacterium]MBK9222507.1 rRNA pseudouridine synthase [Saprospiraceae bacterium]MBK9720460.1 rRNA pseudouridine synthase [Saprospiraceae bacterium]MBK9727431.1 rRNA pseudouridine synthase [Saprospiraceae bacterium]
MMKKTFRSKRKEPIPPPSFDIHYRLNKYIAHCGICSRREAAALVKAGKISVNGAVLDNPAYEVQPADKVSYQDKIVQPYHKAVYLLLNKPKNIITTMDDERGRKTVFDLIKDEIKERVFPIGRLDRNTTGLLLMTNDGELAQKLGHPSHRMKKLYHAVLDKNITKNDLERIMEGVILPEDGKALVDGVDYANDKKNEVGIELHVGKNRIVRRIFEHLGYQVEKLDRVYLAGLTKKNLPRGRYRHLTEKEVIQLKHLKH